MQHRVRPGATAASALIRGDLSTWAAAQRLRDYWPGLGSGETLMPEGDFYQPRAFRVAQELLIAARAPALFASNDVPALGLRVPQARQVHPPLISGPVLRRR